MKEEFCWWEAQLPQQQQNGSIWMERLRRDRFHFRIQGDRITAPLRLKIPRLWFSLAERTLASKWHSILFQMGILGNCQIWLNPESTMPAVCTKLQMVLAVRWDNFGFLLLHCKQTITLHYITDTHRCWLLPVVPRQVWAPVCRPLKSSTWSLGARNELPEKIFAFNWSYLRGGQQQETCPQLKITWQAPPLVESSTSVEDQPKIMKWPQSTSGILFQTLGVRWRTCINTETNMQLRWWDVTMFYRPVVDNAPGKHPF